MEENFTQPGALLDSRTEKEKESDYRIEELVASFAPVEWKEKPRSEWRRFPISNQNGSGSCVAKTGRKMLSVHMFEKAKAWANLSSTHIYQRRVNRPAAGMSAIDVFKIMQEGTTLEEFAPSENLTDSQMDGFNIPSFAIDVGKVFKIGNYIFSPIKDIDTVASIIQQTNKAVMVWFFFRYDEWTDLPQVKDPNLPIVGNGTVRHSVAAVDFTMHNGKKALIIEDSWGPTFGLEGQRVITEDFFKARNYFVGHFMNFKFEEKSSNDDTLDPEKPKHTFTRDLEFSPTFNTDSDVVALQSILKFEGVFPANTDSSGYFGAITRTAVGRFQEKHNIVSAGGPGYGRVGPLTRAKLNQLYA